MKCLYLLLLFFLLPTHLFAQFQENVFGHMTGYSSVASPNGYAIWDNAALVCERPLVVQAGYTADGFQPSFVHTQYFFAQKKFTRDGIAFGYSNLNILDFQRHRLTFVYGRTFNKLSVGARIQQHITNIIAYGNLKDTYFDIGFLYHLNPDVCIASQIEQATIYTDQIKTSPNLRVGLSYKISKQLLLQTEVHRFAYSQSSLAAAIQYHPKSTLNIVAGYDVVQSRLSGGFQFSAKNILFTIAYKNTPPQGILPMLSASYERN